MTEFQKGAIAAQNMNFVILKAIIERPQSQYALGDFLNASQNQLIDDYLAGKSVEFKNGFEYVIDQTSDLDNLFRRWLADRISEGMSNFGGFVIDT